MPGRRGPASSCRTANSAGPDSADCVISHTHTRQIPHQHQGIYPSVSPLRRHQNARCHLSEPRDRVADVVRRRIHVADTQTGTAFILPEYQCTSRREAQRESDHGMTSLGFRRSARVISGCRGKIIWAGPSRNTLLQPASLAAARLVITPTVAPARRLQENAAMSFPPSLRKPNRTLPKGLPVLCTTTGSDDPCLLPAIRPRHRLHNQETGDRSCA